MEEPKKKRWNWAVFLCVVLLGVNLWQGKRLSDLEQAVWNAQNSVMDNVSRLDGRVGSLRTDLESANDLVQDWSYTSAVDRERRGLDIQFSVVLKEWQADTAVELVCGIENAAGGEKVVPLTGSGAGAFTGTVELAPSELSGEYTLDAVIANGETQRRESLGYLGGFAEMLPVQYGGCSFGGPEYTRDAGKNGTLTLSSCGIWLEGLKGDSLPDLTGQMFRLRRNGEIAMEKTAMPENTLQDYTCYELSSQAQIGDRLALTFFCRDGSGLGYEFFLSGWTIDEHGIADQAPETDWPKLTWV